MQKLFYVVCRWLQQDNSRQSMKICDMIKNEMQQVGFNYQSISNTEGQREELYRQRQKLIKEKEKLQEQKRQIQMERQHNIRLIEQKENLQKQRQEMQRRLSQERQQGDQLKQQNEQLEGKRQSMIHQYERLQDERDKIIEQRQLLYERMEKIQKLQRLQRMYQQELSRLREQAHIRGEGQAQEQKNQQEEQNQIQIQIPKSQSLPVSSIKTNENFQNNQKSQDSFYKNQQIQNKSKQVKPEVPQSGNLYSLTNPVQYNSGFTTINSNSTQYSGPISFSSQFRTLNTRPQISESHHVRPSQIPTHSIGNHYVSRQNSLYGSSQIKHQPISQNQNISKANQPYPYTTSSTGYSSSSLYQPYQYRSPFQVSQDLKRQQNVNLKITKQQNLKSSKTQNEEQKPTDQQKGTSNTYQFYFNKQNQRQPQ